MNNFTKVTPKRIYSQSYAIYEMLGSYYNKIIFKNAIEEEKLAINFFLEKQETSYLLEEKILKAIKRLHLIPKIKKLNCELTTSYRDGYYEMLFTTYIVDICCIVKEDGKFIILVRELE